MVDFTLLEEPLVFDKLVLNIKKNVRNAPSEMI